MSSLREPAREVGVSPAAPSRHFRNKQALLDALALEEFDRLVTVLNTAQDEAGESFAERLTLLTRAYMEFAAARLIEDGQRRGEVREGPVDEIGLPVMAALNGYVTLAAAGGIPADGIERGLENMVVFILRGCAP
ncbi:TetR/AcrR family transcriptional regulator [Streptomyces sp. R35]|uniref:TetR/AcrR family transcriptional regulator n=1 Tax=Streptomyces sp. R35 TaxID=3238630 RepID=A0AB39SJ63_9ACTN